MAYPVGANLYPLQDLDLIKKIPTPISYFNCIGINIVPFQDKDALYFLYTDNENKVVKYNLTTKSHSTIKKSISGNKNPNLAKTRIGNFYWIIGDLIDANLGCGEMLPFM